MPIPVPDSGFSVAPAELATYLNIQSIDADRADLLLGLAQAKCEQIVSPLPDAARGVVLDIAARAYTNPTNASSEVNGPYMATYGGISGGLWLTRANKAELRRLSNSSGAFSIDPTPADASPRKAWGQVPLGPDDLWNSPPFYGDWDQTSGA